MLDRLHAGFAFFITAQQHVCGAAECCCIAMSPWLFMQVTNERHA
jgi:hypothetical protein